MENSGENTEQTIKRMVEEVMTQMGFEAEVEIKKMAGEDKEEIVYNIKTTESSFLIGQYGTNLQSLQHIARLIARKKTDEKANFTLDVNSYRQEKNESIIRMAKDMAREAMLERRSVILRPMSPYERRIVHMELSKNDQIKTESTGEGENRRVVIKPADLV